MVLICACLASAQNTAAAQPKLCSAPEQRQLDFWVGEWDLTWPGNNADEIARGIASAEFWTAVSWKENFSGGGAMRLRGKSASIFDVGVGKWKQTWVDNEGGYLDFGGESKDGQMILSREATRPDGTKSLPPMV